ncbi:MAG TPA: response regulator [Mycobacteriales bacterium]|nr:response regulator [Mycobacteriales bacterium]
MTKVLVVDDEPQILRALRVNLSARSYDVSTATTGRQALDAAAKERPDLIVLDLGLPDIDGIDVIQAIRGWSNTPIVILSGRLNSDEKIRALDAGADDYVTKPFNVDELVARVRAVTRRAGGDATTVVQIGDVTVDLQAHRVSKAGADGTAAEVRLTPTEWHLLEILVRNPGRLVTQRELIRGVRGPHHDDVAHYLRQYMAQLRRKIEQNPARPKHLLTEPGMGYRFQPETTVT